MTNPTFTLQTVRLLRGSPLTILIAVILLERAGTLPVTAQLLKDVTGYRDHTITDAIRVLTLPDMQLLTRVKGGWRLSVGFQLPLVVDVENRDIRDISSSSSSSRLEENHYLLEDPLPLPEENRVKRDSLRSNPHFQENVSAARAAGIREPKASQIASLAWVTPKYITAHVHTAESIALAIYRIEHEWEKPHDHTDGSRYVEGEFSEYIQH